MRMSTHNFLEANDSSWKILVNATQRASLAEGHPKTQRKCSSPAVDAAAVVKSYEEFVQELSQINRGNAELLAHDNDHVTTNCAKENAANDLGQENTYVLGDWESDTEIATDEENGYTTRKDVNNNVNWKHSRKKYTRSKSYKDYAKNGSWSAETSSSSGNDDVDVNCEDGHVFSHQDQDENDWDSLSSCSEDLNFEEFLKDTKIPRKENEDSATKYLPYTTLTDFIIRQYYPESESENDCSSKSKGKKGKTFYDDYNKDFRRHGKLKLEDRLPLMQVIDALEDVNKILKNGEITPNMERVLEYKQEYPFTEGYEEEKLGWCPYIVYKIEKLVKKISAKQWPY